MDSREAVIMVGDAIEKRGYAKGWNDLQFTARQVVKLVEEIAEAMDYVAAGRTASKWVDSCAEHMEEAANLARVIFDTREISQGLTILDMEELYSELCDVQVVLLSATDTLGLLLGRDLDIVEDAVAKAEADVERGVRDDND